MSADTEYAAALAAWAPLTALVGARIALSVAQTDWAHPFVIFHSSHENDYCLDNSPTSTLYSFQTDCWAEDAIGALAVAAEVKNAAQDAGALVLSDQAAYDYSTGLNGRILTVEWWDV